MTLRPLLGRAIAGYRHLLSLLSGLLPLLSGIVVLSGLIVLPLWYLATNHREIYTLVLLLFAAGGTLYLILRSARRRRPDAGSLRKAALALASLFSIYLTIRTIALGLYLITPLAAVVALFLTGVALAPKKRV